MKKIALLFAFAFCFVACGGNDSPATSEPTETAEQFVARVNAELVELNTEGGAIGWVRATYINHDTAILAARSDEEYAAWHSKTVAESLKYADQDLSPETARAIEILKLGTSQPAPNDDAKRKELAKVTTDLSGLYGAGQYCPDDGRVCMALGDLEEVVANSRDYDEILDAWVGWRTVGPAMRPKYERFAELANEGAGVTPIERAKHLIQSRPDGVRVADDLILQIRQLRNQ